MTLDLEQFLEQLASEGEKDSSGVFTLDPLEAQRKLRRYQFQYAYAFVGAFMAAAALAGSTSVAVDVDPARLTVHWSSPWLKPAQLEALLSFLLRERVDAPLRELALGVNSALALKPTRLELASGTYRQHFRGDKSWQTEETEAIAGLRLVVEYPRTSRLKRSLCKEMPEVQLIRQNCLFAAPYIVVNDEALRPASPGGRCLVAALLEGGPPETMRSLRASLPKSSFQLKFDSPGPHCGAFGLYLDQPESVGLVVDGLVFPVPDLHLPGAWGIVPAPQLKRDLSAFALVRDEAYEEMVTAVRQIFDAILKYYCQGWGTLDLETRRASAIVLIHYAAQKVMLGEVFAAHDLYAQVVREYEDFGQKHDLLYFEAAYALWLLSLRESLSGDDYHAREFFRTFSKQVKEALQLELALTAIGIHRGAFRVVHATNGTVCEDFLHIVAGADRLILGETHPWALFHESRAARPTNLQAMLSAPLFRGRGRS